MTSIPSITGNQPEELGKKKLCFTMPELVCRQKEVHGGEEPRSHVVQRITKALDWLVIRDGEGKDS